MFRCAVVVAFLPLIAFAESSNEETKAFYGKKHYRASIRHIESGGIGYNQGYTTLEAFFATDPNRSTIIPFIDLRGHVFDNGKFAANAGFGLRTLAHCRVYGANVYYDYRQTKRRHYNQIGFGLETMGIRWDFRANGYLLFGSRKSSFYDIHTTSSSVFDSFQGNYALIKQTQTAKGKVQYAMSGVNAEAAFHILKNENIDFYASAGPYYYRYDSKQAIGGQARVGAQIYEYLTLEVINSYDSRFHENFQGSVGINIPFGPRPKISENKKFAKCSSPSLLAQRLVQDVARQEIIVVDSKRRTTVSETVSPAINPATGLPYFFVFVDNTSSSEGTYESPYHNLAQAQANSGPNDILYIFPGDGTTTGMDSGIFLQPNQQMWGSGLSYAIQTSSGTFLIPAQSSLSPTLTNTNVDTEGNIITLATNNVIQGVILTSALNDAIYGTDPQNLTVSSCTFENTNTFAIEATFSGDASVSVTNNQFLNNVNGIFLTLNGTSNIICSDNLFTGQTSVSEVPFAISAANNTISSRIENNVFSNNTTGTVRWNLDNVTNADITLRNNTITQNGTGFQSSLASSLAILPNGTNDHCSITLAGNTFSDNASNALYVHTSGQINTLEITASANTLSDNGGSAIVVATQVDTLTLLATDNTIARCNDNGIAIINSTHTSSIGNIEMNNNSITDIGNGSNGIAVNQDFNTLNLTLLNNVINNCEGSGILSYAPNGIDSFALNVSGNTIGNCQNLSSNAASGLDIEQYVNLVGSVTNNTFSNNLGTSLTIGSTLSLPTTCLTLDSNDNSTDYFLSNPIGGLFNLSPCDSDTGNGGIINTSGTITSVQSCVEATPCPP